MLIVRAYARNKISIVDLLYKLQDETQAIGMNEENEIIELKPKLSNETDLLKKIKTNKNR